MQKKQIKILLTGGGTGGHVLPILAVVEEAKEIASQKDLELEFLHIGTNPEKEKEIIEEAGIKYDHVMTGKFRRYFSPQNFIDMFKVPLGILQAYFKVKKFDPDVVFGKGGFASVPAVVAAGWLHKKILIHESDTSPGLANKKLEKYATKIALGFARAAEYFPKGKTIVTGNPIRVEILLGNKESGLQTFGFDGARPIIFVTGGSTGARTVNHTIVKALPKLLEKYDVIHQCGQISLQDTLDCLGVFYKKDSIKKLDHGYEISGQNYRLYPYLKKEMADAYACADIIIARAGASNITEIAALSKPSVLVPLPLGASRGEQISNAGMFAKAGASKVFVNEQFKALDLIEYLDEVFTDKDVLRGMGTKAKQFYKSDAEEEIAKAILELAK